MDRLVRAYIYAFSSERIKAENGRVLSVKRASSSPRTSPFPSAKRLKRYKSRIGLCPNLCESSSIVVPLKKPRLSENQLPIGSPGWPFNSHRQTIPRLMNTRHITRVELLPPIRSNSFRRACNIEFSLERGAAHRSSEGVERGRHVRTGHNRLGLADVLSPIYTGRPDKSPLGTLLAISMVMRLAPLATRRRRTRGWTRKRADHDYEIGGPKLSENDRQSW